MAVLATVGVPANEKSHGTGGPWGSIADVEIKRMFSEKHLHAFLTQQNEL